MKNLLSILLILILCFATKGQDQIVTKAGDTLNCKITRISSSYIHFEISDITGPIRSRIEHEKVLSYFRAKEAEEPKIEISDPQIPEDVTISDRFASMIDSRKFRLALNTGFTYQFGGYKNHPKSYARQLRSFFHFGTELQFFPTDGFGIGVKYTRISTSAQENFDPFFAPLFGALRIEEKVRFHTIGLSLTNRQPKASDQLIYYSISGGMAIYRDEGTKDGNPFFEHAETFAVGLDIGYDSMLSDNFAVGFNLGVNIARINKLDIPTGTVGTNFDISRIDLTVGLRLLK